MQFYIIQKIEYAFFEITNLSFLNLTILLMYSIILIIEELL